MKLEQEKLISNFAFNFNLRRYRWVDGGGCGGGRSVAVRGGGGGVTKDVKADKQGGSADKTKTESKAKK